MAKQSIVITDCDHPSVNIEKEYLEDQGFTVELEQCLTEEDVLQKCTEAEGLINQYAPLTKKVLSQLPNCKVIVRYGVGVDNIDVPAATEAGIQICNVPDYGIEEVSDHSLALLFSLARKINLLSNEVKKNNWDFRISLPIHRLRDLTIGIVGLGRIGQATARKAHGMGLKVIGHDRREKYAFEGMEYVSFDELIERADIISIHVPLQENTHHLFNEAVFKKMKNSALIINTARGPIIDEDALAKALQEGEISGAAIDVLEKEPPVPDHPLFRFENVILTPHSAWYSEESFYDLKRKAAEEAARVVQGNSPNYPVNQLLNRKGAF